MLDEEKNNQAEGANYFNSAPTTEQIDEINQLKKELDDYKSENENLKKEIESYKDKALRVAAELQNYQTRIKRESEETSKYIVSKFANDLLNVHDNLHRTIDSIKPEQKEHDVYKSIIQGIEFTLKEFDNVLSRYGINRIMPEKGTEFDPNLHEALSSIVTNEHPDNSVVDTIQAGFSIHDRVLRAARVIIAKTS